MLPSCSEFFMHSLEYRVLPFGNALELVEAEYQFVMTSGSTSQSAGPSLGAPLVTSAVRCYVSW